jgi:plastocyanin
MRWKALIALAVVCALGALIPATPAAAVRPRPYNVIISGFEYHPNPSVAVGGLRVRVLNRDSVLHTVTADDGSSFDLHLTGRDHGSFVAPRAPGQYPFHCEFHDGMHGELIIV